MKSFVCLSGVSLMLFWMGCGSKVPVRDTSQAVFVPELVGRWQIVSEAPDEMVVLRFNDVEYYVELREHPDDPLEADTLRLRAYITPVDGIRVVNVQNIDTMKEDERLYFFYVYDLSPDGTLTLTELNDVGDVKIDNFVTSEALYAFIRQNLHNDALYGESVALVRGRE